MELYDNKPGSYYEWPRTEMLSFVPKEARKILDIGCGSGMFASQLKAERRAEVWGIELSKEASEKARKKVDKIIIGNIETDTIDLPKNYFDCIIFNDVLEHFRDPWAILQYIKSALVTNGYIVASIPNIRYFTTFKILFFNKEWEYVDSGILDKTHLRFFTQGTIEELFQSSGYKILKIEGINSIQFPWKIRLFNWLLNKKFEDMRYLQFGCIAQKS